MGTLKILSRNFVSKEPFPKFPKVHLGTLPLCVLIVGEMIEEFTIDFTTGIVFAIVAWFVAYGCSAMFQAFKLPGDAG